jgi:LPPG:FO 2-phospho-L-lactate transferase
MEFRGLIDGIVIDNADEALAEGVRASGFEVLCVPTFMRNAEDRLKLARAVLEFARTVRSGREVAAGA